MQLQGATELERRIYEMCREVETTLPASEFETRLVCVLSDAGTELQRHRGFWPPGSRPEADRLRTMLEGIVNNFYEFSDQPGCPGLSERIDAAHRYLAGERSGAGDYKVYSRPECIFRLCPNTDNGACRAQDRCLQPKS
jgi:hypothetical protein